MEFSCSTNNNQSLDSEGALLVSADTLAQMLEISVRTLWRLRAAGKLPAPVRLGGSVRWRPRDIESWITAGCPKVSR